MRIHADFECGNIKVLEQDGDRICLQNEMRDTEGDWFYWAFCVEGAQGRTLTFTLDKKWVGYHGAAVSHDLIHWHWTDSRESESSFTYSFGETEEKVYLAHDLVYSPSRLDTVLKELQLTAQTLCQSRRGRDVPFLRVGQGSRNIVLTSRHHACESTGTYVLEGFVREYLASPIEDTCLLIVPMIDYDGVCDGDQGKNRAPHDHNRDYIEEPVHPETRALMELAGREGAYLAFDFHAPWHINGRNDRVFIVRKDETKKPLFDLFGTLLQAQCGEGTMRYDMANDYPPNTKWNRDDTPTFATFFRNIPGCCLSFTLETTYFGTAEDRVTEEKLLGTGRAFCRAVRLFDLSGK